MPEKTAVTERGLITIPGTEEKPTIDPKKCAACGHDKHFGKTCGERVEISQSEFDNCACSDAHTRKDDKKKQGGFYLLPWGVLGKLAEIYHYGAKKYAPNSWQNLPPDPETNASARERYEDAMFRHWGKFKDGEWLDHESGKPHLAHFLWGAVAVFWFELKAHKEL